MNQELTKKLLEKYPKIFRQHKLPLIQTAMCWLFECGNGWYNLVDKLCHILQFNTDNNEHPQVEATQVKEKFGGLSFYYHSIPLKEDQKNIERYYGQIDGAVSFAEYLSNYICEQCGSMDNVKQTKGWIVTLCDNCMTLDKTERGIKDD